MPNSSTMYSPGQRVRVTQQVPRRGDGGGPMSIQVEGTVVKFEQQKTGSWYAHGKDDKLWLDRLEIRRDDGEQVVMNLDRYSRVEVVE
jgi:hypothetical protein